MKAKIQRLLEKHEENKGTSNYHEHYMETYTKYGKATSWTFLANSMPSSAKYEYKVVGTKSGIFLEEQEEHFGTIHLYRYKLRAKNMQYVDFID